VPALPHVPGLVRFLAELLLGPDGTEPEREALALFLIEELVTEAESLLRRPR